METVPSVILQPGEADRVVAGHPWIYGGSVARVTAPVQDGQVVQVRDHRRRFVGMGFWNSRSKIQVRVIAFERVEINQAFFQQRIQAALELRQRHLPGATTFRVVNSESDSLSGLIVDKYEDVLVVQFSALGMDQRKSQIVAALQKLFAPRAILDRSDIAARKFEGLPEASGLLAGHLDGEVEVKINGLTFAANLLTGQKTGLYLDQQVNYLLVSNLVRGGQVLDCFSFLGGFALHAARAGAAHVHAVEQSAEAVALAERNARANGLADRCTFHTANVFDWLKAHTAKAPRPTPALAFDLIILDPPSFTRHRTSVQDALRGYKEIHLRALKLLKPGGTLVTFCCSHHVDARTFQDVILAAAYDTRKRLRRIAVYTQAPDHPVIPAIPETEYLKGFAFELIH